MAYDLAILPTQSNKESRLYTGRPNVHCGEESGLSDPVPRVSTAAGCLTPHLASMENATANIRKRIFFSNVSGREGAFLHYVLVSAILACFAWCVNCVDADLLSIADGNASFGVVTDAGVTNYNAFLGGHALPNVQSNESWFIGPLGGPLSELTNASVSGAGNSQTLSFTSIRAGSGLFDIDISYTIQDLADFPRLDIASTVTNRGTSTGAAEHVTLVNYFNYDLFDEDFSSDSAIFVSGDPAAIVQSNPFMATVRREAASVDRWELSELADLADDLVGGIRSTLNNATSPLNSVDVVGAFQWDMYLEPQESFSIEGVVHTSEPQPIVPEPQAAIVTSALSAVGLMLGVRLRRRRSKVAG